jgi:hypothetical protein
MIQVKHHVGGSSSPQISTGRGCCFGHARDGLVYTEVVIGEEVPLRIHRRPCMRGCPRRYGGAGSFGNKIVSTLPGHVRIN